MINIDRQDIAVWGHGFFQDIKTLMQILKHDTITENDVDDLIKIALQETPEDVEERELYKRAENEMRWFNKKRCPDVVKRIERVKMVSSSQGTKKEGIVKNRHRRR